MPLMFATYSAPRVASNASPAGYQPVGKHPTSLLCGGAKSITATELFVPFEANNRRPSALIANVFGALPNGNFFAGRVEIVSATLRIRVSMTDSVSLDALATTT